jgi:hypothetical protein
MKPLKKIVSLIIALNLLFSVAGVARYAHYCGDKLFSLSYFSKTSCCCGDDNADGCCKNEVTVVQLKNDCISSEKSSVSKPSLTPVLFSINTTLLKEQFCTANNIAFFNKEKNSYHAPPLYLKNRVFLI